MNIATIRLKSKVLAMPTEVIVLMPEDARASKENMKILWLLHGAQCDDRTYLYHVDFADMLSKHRMLSFTLPVLKPTILLRIGSLHLLCYDPNPEDI